MDGIFQVVSITANQPVELRFLGEVLKTLSIGRLFEQVREFFVAALSGVFGIEQILYIGKRFAVHRGGEIVQGFSGRDFRGFPWWSRPSMSRSARHA